MRVSPPKERERVKVQNEFKKRGILLLRYSFLTVSKVCRPISVSSKYYSLLKKNVFHKKIQSL